MRHHTAARRIYVQPIQEDTGITSKNDTNGTRRLGICRTYATRGGYRMKGSQTPSFDRLLVSPQFIDDLNSLSRDNPDGASKVARTVCNLLVDIGAVNRKRIKNTKLKLYRVRPPGDYRSVDLPQGDGATALLRVLHRKEVYRWVDRYTGEVPDELLPVRASPLMQKQMHRVVQEDEGNGHHPPADPVPRRQKEDPVGLSDPGDLMTIARQGMEKYLSVLSDEQRQMLDRLDKGPAVIRGPAGSGKTIMALHLTQKLYEESLQRNLLDDGGRILLLDFGRTLRENLRSMLAYLFEGQPPEEIEVINIHRWCENYLTGRTDRWPTGISAASRSRSSRGSIFNAIRTGQKEGLLDNLQKQQVYDEITSFIIRRRFRCLSEYLEADRTGRGFPLRSEAREKIWKVYQIRQKKQQIMRAWGYDDLINMTLDELESDDDFQPYRYVIVDEAQDFSVAMLQLTRKLAGEDESNLFLFGDVAQSLYDPSFRWKDAKLTIRGGQVRTLKSSHRCARRIFQAARVLIQPLSTEQPADYDDPDVFTHDGEKPRVAYVSDEESQLLLLTEEIQSLVQGREASPQSIAVIARTNKALQRMRDRLGRMEIACEYFRDNVESRIRFDDPSVKLVTIHSAKGLGFPHVFMPVEPPGDDDRWDETHERKALFTAMTRAGVSLVILTPSQRPHPLIKEIVDAGQASVEHPG